MRLQLQHAQLFKAVVGKRAYICRLDQQRTAAQRLRRAALRATAAFQAAEAHASARKAAQLPSGLLWLPHGCGVEGFSGILINAQALDAAAAAGEQVST